MVRPSTSLCAAFLAVLSLGATLLLGGTAPFGRIALAVGQPALAVSLLEDPYWKGVALYRLGRFDEAVAAFRAAGQPAFYDRGNALAHAGRYAEAVALYDAVLFHAPEDEDARVNRALVDALIERDDGEWRAGGSIPAEGAQDDIGAETTTESAMKSTSAEEEEEPRYRGPLYSGKLVAASREWLATLADEPGRYLKLRIAAEHKKRLERGTEPQAGDDPW